MIDQAHKKFDQNKLRSALISADASWLYSTATKFGVNPDSCKGGKREDLQSRLIERINVKKQVQEVYLEEELSSDEDDYGQESSSSDGYAAKMHQQSQMVIRGLN